MKLNNKKTAGIKLKPSIGFMMMACFLIFSFVLLLLLWVFQTVFLDSFYRTVKISQMKSYVSVIADILENEGSDTDDLRDIISTQSEMSILIYDTNENLYTQLFPSPDGGKRYYVFNTNIKDHEVYRFYKAAKENGGTYTESDNNADFKIPVGNTPDGGTRLPYGGSLGEHFNIEKRDLESVVCAQIVNGSDGHEYFIVIDALVTPVTGMVETLRIQLIIVTWILIVLSVVLAFILSRMIAKPIVRINKNAKELAKQNYEVGFSGGAYREIQELNDTLNYATSELSKVEKLRQELIANVSHDLRTPLTMIIGYGEVIRDLPGENTPENIQIIIDEASHLNTLVNDLLDLSKLQSGSQSLEPEIFSLTETVKNIFMRYSKLVGNGFKILFESGGDVSVNADELKLTQVIYNLINNAVNYAGNDKTVIVRQTVNENKVTVEVEDHGQGIEPDKLEFIWDRYYKVDKSHKSSVIGTGLGLSIVKNILDLHGAQYGVKSNPGEGSVFWFSMPCTQFNPYESGVTTLYLDAEGNISPYSDEAVGTDCDELTDSSEKDEAL